MKDMIRAELTEKIVAHKMLSGFKWADVADKVGQSKEWTTAAIMGQMSMTKEQAEAAGNAIGINFGDEEIGLLIRSSSGLRWFCSSSRG